MIVIVMNYNPKFLSMFHEGSHLKFLLGTLCIAQCSKMEVSNSFFTEFKIIRPNINIGSVSQFFLRSGQWMRWFKALCTYGSAIYRKYEIFLTKFSNVPIKWIRLNTDIVNVSWFFLGHTLWGRWFQSSFVERPAHRTVQ